MLYIELAQTAKCPSAYKRVYKTYKFYFTVENSGMMMSIMIISNYDDNYNDPNPHPPLI